MKSKFLPLVVASFLIFTSQSMAQLSKVAVGGGLNFTNYMGNLSQGNLGLNIRVSYDIFEKGTASAGFIYGFPLKSSYTAEANSLSSQNSSSYIDVPAEMAINFKTFYVNFNYFFVKDNESPFGVYALLGAGLTVASFKTTYGPYDHSKYSIPGSSDDEPAEMGFIINGGAGLQAKVGPAVIFGEGLFGLPATSVNGDAVENNIPFSVGANLGVKFHLGGSSNSSKKGKSKKRK